MSQQLLAHGSIRPVCLFEPVRKIKEVANHICFTTPIGREIIVAALARFRKESSNSGELLTLTPAPHIFPAKFRSFDFY